MTSPFAPVPPRDLAKMIVDTAITFEVSRRASRAITEHTSFDEDSRAVNVGTTVFGMYVATKLSPITDKAVNVTFDFVAKQRARRQAKKDEKNNTEEK